MSEESRLKSSSNCTQRGTVVEELVVDGQPTTFSTYQVGAVCMKMLDCIPFVYPFVCLFAFAVVWLVVGWVDESILVG